MNHALIALIEKHYPVWSDLPETLRDRFINAAQVKELSDNTLLFDEGALCEYFPLVLEGAVRVSKRNANGRELQLYRVFPGESCVISSSCLLGHSNYVVRGMTESKTQLVLLPKPLFIELLADPHFRDFVFRLFADRISELIALVEAVVFRKLDQRLAELLLGHGRKVLRTHQQLADELGSVREIISRLLKNFADQELVRLGREQIEVINAEGLRQISQSS